MSSDNVLATPAPLQTASSRTSLRTPGGKSTVSSRVGSLENIHHTPTNSTKKIFSETKKYKVASKVGSLDNIHHHPSGGDKKIVSQKLDFTHGVKSRVGSLDNIAHVPATGDKKNKKIVSQKLDFTHGVKSKVGSLDNIAHVPSRGGVKIPTQKLHFKETAKPRIESRVEGGIVKKSGDAVGQVAKSTDEGMAHAVAAV
ncbi:hypothetical protein PhCBS80983_g03925 [Powellomyces hirtus]|uniref:Microtubule-associated protein n=1 Tax=Powellomyces hirtus TaxID=109895 RepID=A0A507E0N2_9FUNG|nr:hypothetical protein PhCBS80983_g03925 [Powellomyces hirtus]